MVVLVVQAWRTQRGHQLVLRAATWTGAVFLVEILAAALLLVGGFNEYLLVIYTAAAAIFWSLLVALTVLSGLTPAA